MSASSETYPSVCPLDCGDTCSLTVEVEDGAISRVRGSSVNPLTAGKICMKVATGFPELVHGKKRLTTPMRRVGAKGSAAFEAISWDEALDSIHDRYSQIISESGAEAIIPLTYGGPMGLICGGSMSKRFFHRLGASLLKSTPLCAGASSEAYESIFGDTPGITYDEMVESKLIVIWGNNITVANLHLTRTIRQAKSLGAKLVVIDPKRTRIAEEADLHLALLPGTDVILGYAIAAELERQSALDRDFIAANVKGADAYLARAREFSLSHAAEQCGLAIEELEIFAAFWRDLKPACTIVGVAPERNRNGGGGLRAAYALPVLTGNFGVEGAGVCNVSAYFPVNHDALERPDFAPEGIRELSILSVTDHILDPSFAPPIRSVFIYDHNPVAVHPRQNKMREALSQEDLFVVGCDISMTDSMAYADIILPACTHFEYDDIFISYGHQYLQRAEPVIAPVGDSLPNTEIFRRLAQRFGFDDPAFLQSDHELIDLAIDRTDPRMGGRGGMDIGTDEVIDLAVSGTPSVLRGIDPDTPSGKAELYSEELEERLAEGLPSFRPLARTGAFILVSPSSDRRTNSTFGGVTALAKSAEVEMNPADAQSLAFTDGQRVQLFNVQGKVILKLKISKAIRTGTLYVQKGAWLETSETGMTINALVPGHIADLGAGACYNDTQVDIASA